MSKRNELIAANIQEGDDIRFLVPTRDGTKRGPRKVKTVREDLERVEVYLNGWGDFRIRFDEITHINGKPVESLS